MGFPVIKAVSACLAHVPGQVRNGSKPVRELPRGSAEYQNRFFHSLRDYRAAVGYAPHQVFIGNMSPDGLWDVPRPWYQHPDPGASSDGPLGSILSERQFLGLLKMSDQFDLVNLEAALTLEAAAQLENHPLLQPGDLTALGAGAPLAEIERMVAAGALPLWVDSDRLAGCMLSAHDEDEALSARVLLEDLACKATGMWALRTVLHDGPVSASEIEYILGCGEEAAGDRYQRGGSGMAKAFGEMAGCLGATGSDLKVFCDAPVHAVVMAAAMVQAGLFKNVAVVGGGSYAKLGMKFQGHLNKGMPILEDVLGAIALVIGEDDGVNPQIRLDTVGKHAIGVDSRPQALAEVLVSAPLARLGWKLSDIDKFATEMHNPEITDTVGSGNVPRTNYMIIGSLGVLRGEFPASDLEAFVRKHGMPGFSPTQGHIASAVAYAGHAWTEMRAGRMERALFMAKGSLFLGRMTRLSDGMSFILQAQGNK